MFLLVKLFDFIYWQLTDMVNQINEPSEINTGVLQTPVSGKGGKAKKSARSVKSNITGMQASGFNAGEFWPEMVCLFF